MISLAAHLRYTLRSFRRNPGLTAVAVSSLALGIGANTAIFSLADRLLLRTLPVNDPRALVLLTANGPRRGSVDTPYDDTLTFSYPMYQDFRDRAPMLDGVAGWFPAPASLSRQGQTERIAANLVTGNYFQVLGVPMAMGRPIVAEDAGAPGSSPVAVLSHAFWEQRLGGDAGVLNQPITLNGQPFTVIGVAARGFQGLAVGETPAVFVPVTMMAQILPGRDDLEQRRYMWLNLMARLRPGVSREAAEAALNVFWRPILEAELEAMPQATAAFRQRFVSRHLSLRTGASGISALRAMFADPLKMLMGLVGLVLLIACANVANLLMARAAGRQKEIAVRLAIGASPSDILTQILVESVALSLAGGALGVLLAGQAGEALLRFLPFDRISAGISAVPDWRILGFTAVVSIVCGLVFGLAPAFETTHPDLASTLKEQTGAPAGAAHVRLRKGLVAGQVGLSLLLLLGAGLFLQSLKNLRRIDLGFRPDHLVSFTIQPSLNGYDAPRSIALFDRLRQRIAVLPGIQSVAATQTPLLTGEDVLSSIVVPGREPKENENAPNVAAVSPGYFAGLGMPILAGREFTEADAGRAPSVAVINQAFAQQYFDTANPMGRSFYFTSDRKTPVTIVGVAKDGKYGDLREAKQPFIFRPYAQGYSPGEGGMTWYVRTSREPLAAVAMLRQAVRDSDSTLPVFDVKTMEQQIDDSVFANRILSTLTAFFALLATGLAAIGLYGVMSYAVARRTREIGIRMALGARPGEVVSMVLREVALLAGGGIAVAIPLAYPLTRLARSMLYGVAPGDAGMLAAAACVLAAAALAAGYFPAARAARIDPQIALRQE